MSEAKVFTIPPNTFLLDGARVTILEVSKLVIGDRITKYLCSCYVECCGYRSRTFNLLVESNRELVAKLKAEIAKMKLFIRLGLTHLFIKI